MLYCELPGHGQVYSHTHPVQDVHVECILVNQGLHGYASGQQDNCCAFRQRLHHPEEFLWNLSASTMSLSFMVMDKGHGLSAGFTDSDQALGYISRHSVDSSYAYYISWLAVLHTCILSFSACRPCCHY